MAGDKEASTENKLSAKEIKEENIKRIVSEVEQITPGQLLVYKVPEYLGIMGAVFLIIELNYSYPGKGKKYVVSTDKMADGKPSGQRVRSFESNKPVEYANWVVDRIGERYGQALTTNTHSQ
jgi:hypothetical protein